MGDKQQDWDNLGFRKPLGFTTESDLAAILLGIYIPIDAGEETEA
jgi:hypothetical protein